MSTSEPGNDKGVNAKKEDILHGCDIVGVYVYSEKRLYNYQSDHYTYYFSDHREDLNINDNES